MTKQKKKKKEITRRSSRRRRPYNDNKTPATKRETKYFRVNTEFGVSGRTHLYPFLCLLKRGVCGRLGRRVMLMRRSYICNRTGHWRRGSALQVFKPEGVCKSASVPRYSTKISSEPRLSVRSPPSVVGVAAAAAPARRTNQFLLSGIAPVGESVDRQPRSSQRESAASGASGMTAQNKSLN